MNKSCFTQQRSELTKELCSNRFIVLLCECLCQMELYCSFLPGRIKEYRSIEESMLGRILFIGFTLKLIVGKV